MSDTRPARATPKPRIRFHGVGKRFDETVALHPIDLRIEDRRTTAVIGPSGCGKSTILRLIIGLLEPTCGHVEFDGRRVTPAAVLALRRKMGYVIQGGGLFPHLTAGDNVTLMARHLRRPGDATRSRLGELCRLTHFPPDLLKRFPAELSGGQAQRVSLMRALILDPEVLLLDEPLGALDPMVRAALQAELQDIFRSLGKTVVLVTHDLAEAGFLGDRIVLLRAGRIIQRGTLDDLRERPAEPFVSEFLSAQRSLVEL